VNTVNKKYIFNRCFLVVRTRFVREDHAKTLECVNLTSTMMLGFVNVMVSQGSFVKHSVKKILTSKVLNLSCL